MIKLFCDFCSNELTDKDMQYMGIAEKNLQLKFAIVQVALEKLIF